MSELLKQGSKGDAVKQFQAELKAMGFDLAADGVFGAGTKQAVEDLQHLFGYTVDGIVGPGTIKLITAQKGHGFQADAPDAVLKALKAQGKTTEKGSLAGADLVRTLKKGHEGADVRYLQRRLMALGFAVDLDGKFGPGCEQAVRNLQESFGYTVDGIVGAGTHTLLNAQIGHGWKAPA